MKIVFLTNNLTATDGWSRYSLDLIKELHAQGHEVLCLVNKKSTAGLAERVVLANPLRYLANPWLSWITARKIRPLLSEFQPDLIHIIAEPYATILLFLKNFSGRSVLTVHGSYAYPPALLNNPLRSFISRLLTQIVYRRLDLVIAVSHFTQKHLLDRFCSSQLLPVLSHKIKVITNGLDLTSFPPRDPDNQGGHKTKKILFVGGVKSGKGVWEALAGLADYKNNFSQQFQFDIVGNFEPTDPYYLQLQKLIIAEQLTEQVSFHGRVGESALLNFYRAADLFLMPSLNVADKWIEGFGLVYLEAASQGVPSIGSYESGAGDALIDGQTGYLVDAHNPADIAEHINLILNKHTIRAEDCLAWARKNDIKIKVQEILALYKLNGTNRHISDF